MQSPQSPLEAAENDIPAAAGEAHIMVSMAKRWYNANINECLTVDTSASLYSAAPLPLSVPAAPPVPPTEAYIWASLSHKIET